MRARSLGVASTIAVALALAGCVSQTSRVAGPSAKPVVPQRWNAAAAREATAGALLVVRGRELKLTALQGGPETTLWSAPASTTPGILAVDRAGGRIAILLHEANPATMPPRERRLYDPTPYRDAGIVVLNADGSAPRFKVDSHVAQVQGTMGVDGRVVASVDTTRADTVSSGAFLGQDLFLGTDGPTQHYGGPGRPWRMTPQGEFLPVASHGGRWDPRPTGFVQMSRGYIATLYTMGDLGGDFTGVAVSRMDNGALRAVTGEIGNWVLAGFSSEFDDTDQVGASSATDTIAFPQHWAMATGLGSATWSNGAWHVRHLAPRLTDRSEWTDPTVAAPLQGPAGSYLVPVRGRLMRVDAVSGQSARTSVQVGPPLDRLPLVHSWAYLGTGFGKGR